MAEGRRRPPGPKRQIVEYQLADGWKVLVGRTDRDNDYLTFEVARPADWWFHVHGVPGSHVVLQGPPEEEAGRDVLRQAASIAAWHSKAKEAGVVPVSCTRARDVSKPRGAPAGTVTIRRESTLKVRPGTGGAVTGDTGTDHG